MAGGHAFFAPNLCVIGQGGFRSSVGTIRYDDHVDRTSLGDMHRDSGTTSKDFIVRVGGENKYPALAHAGCGCVGN
jgi:hypothetical protein